MNLLFKEASLWLKDLFQPEPVRYTWTASQHACGEPHFTPDISTSLSDSSILAQSTQEAKSSPALQGSTLRENTHDQKKKKKSLSTYHECVCIYFISMLAQVINQLHGDVIRLSPERRNTEPAMSSTA